MSILQLLSSKLISCPYLQVDAHANPKVLYIGAGLNMCSMLAGAAGG